MCDPSTSQKDITTNLFVLGLILLNYCFSESLKKYNIKIKWAEAKKRGYRILKKLTLILLTNHVSYISNYFSEFFHMVASKLGYRQVYIIFKRIKGCHLEYIQ